MYTVIRGDKSILLHNSDIVVSMRSQIQHGNSYMEAQGEPGKETPQMLQTND